MKCLEITLDPPGAVLRRLLVQGKKLGRPKFRIRPGSEAEGEPGDSQERVVPTSGGALGRCSAPRSAGTRCCLQVLQKNKGAQTSRRQARENRVIGKNSGNLCAEPIATHATWYL